MLKACFYVDGFNLYYGSLKKTKYKWLDLNKLFSLYYPNYKIEKIKYFSALTKGRKHDLNKPVRQQTYFRALRTNPNTEIILGSFLENEVYFHIPEKTRLKQQQKVNVLSLFKIPAYLPLFGKNYLAVNKTEEKGSDVNLGAHLVMDAYEGDFDVAVVVSNDSDLVEPIRIVNNMTKLRVRLLNPYSMTQSTLKAVTQQNGIKYIRGKALQSAQFAANMTDSTGNFYIPPEWK